MWSMDEHGDLGLQQHLNVLLMMLLRLHEGSLVLLYFRSVRTVHTAGPDIETYFSDGGFATYVRGGLSCVASRH